MLRLLVRLIPLSPPKGERHCPARQPALSQLLWYFSLMGCAGQLCLPALPDYQVSLPLLFPFSSHQTWTKVLHIPGVVSSPGTCCSRRALPFTQPRPLVGAIRATPADGREAVLTRNSSLPPFLATAKKLVTGHCPGGIPHPVAFPPGRGEGAGITVNRLAAEQLRVGVCFNSPDHLKNNL